MPSVYALIVPTLMPWRCAHVVTLDDQADLGRRRPAAATTRQAQEREGRGAWAAVYRGRPGYHACHSSRSDTAFRERARHAEVRRYGNTGRRYGSHRVRPNAFGCITIPFLLVALIPLGYGARSQWSNGTLMREGEVVEGRVVELERHAGQLLGEERSRECRVPHGRVHDPHGTSAQDDGQREPLSRALERRRRRRGRRRSRRSGPISRASSTDGSSGSRFGAPSPPCPRSSRCFPWCCSSGRGQRRSPATDMLATIGFVTVLVLLVLLASRRYDPCRRPRRRADPCRHRVRPRGLGRAVRDVRPAADGAGRRDVRLRDPVLRPHDGRGPAIPVVNGVLRAIGTNPTRIVAGSAVLAAAVHLDGAGAVTFLVTYRRSSRCTSGCGWTSACSPVLSRWPPG